MLLSYYCPSWLHFHVVNLSTDPPSSLTQGWILHYIGETLCIMVQIMMVNKMAIIIMEPQSNQ